MVSNEIVGSRSAIQICQIGSNRSLANTLQCVYGPILHLVAESRPLQLQRTAQGSAVIVSREIACSPGGMHAGHSMQQRGAKMPTWQETTA